LAELDFDDVRSPQVLATLRAVEQKGLHETAHRALTYACQIFNFGDACGFLTGKNPTASLRDVLAPVSVTHHASIYSPDGLGELMLSIEGYSGHEITAIALDIIPRTITRSKELRYAEWWGNSRSNRYSRRGDVASSLPISLPPDQHQIKTPRHVGEHAGQSATDHWLPSRHDDSTRVSHRRFHQS